MQAQGNEGEPVGAKDTQDVRGRSGYGPSEGTALVSAAGLGFVRGLTFPLMISSTFLQEMSLSHGAGNSFGALFFLAYALTMAATAIRHPVSYTHLLKNPRIAEAQATAKAVMENEALHALAASYMQGKDERDERDGKI